MKTLIQFLFVLFFAVQSYAAASVRLYFIDPFTGSKDTNVFYIIPIGTNVLSNGGVVTKGIPRKVTPSADGNATNTLAVGHYSVTNRALGSGIVIRVPNTSTFYDYTNLLVSGYNIFVTIENGEASTSTLNTNTIRILTSTNLNLLDGYLVRGGSQVIADGDWVFGGNLSGDAISSWSVAADGDAEFNDISATNITATSLAGLVLNQMTNIASGSSVSAAQVNAIIKTNDGYYTARHINLDGGMRNLRGALVSNVPPKILVISDNSFSTHEYLPLMTTNYLPLNGSLGKASGTQIGNYFYNAWNGLGTFSAEDGTDTFFARSHFMLANGGMVSNISGVVNGFNTSAIQVRGWKLSSFGTLQVLTNTVGGTTNLFRTIDCATGASLSAFVTNWTIPTITNLVVTVKSIGTNILMDIGQWNTNIYSGAVWDFWESQNFGFSPFTDTAAHSNYFRTFVLNSGYHAVIVDDIAGSNSLYLGISYFNDMLTNSGIDFLVTTPVAPTNDVPTWLDTRDAVLTAARDFNIAAIDVSPYFLNTALNGWQYFDEIHQIRTNAIGNAARKRDAAISIGGQLVSVLGLNYEKFQPFGYTNLANPSADISGKANLAGGNDFSGNQTVNGYIASTGTVATVRLHSRTDNSRQFDVLASGNAFRFNDSAESGSWFVKSNASGTVTVNFLPYGGANVVRFGDSSFLRYWGDGASLTNLLFKTNYVAAEFAPTSGYIKFVGSNNALYAVSATKTNLISAP